MERKEVINLLNIAESQVSQLKEYKDYDGCEYFKYELLTYIISSNLIDNIRNYLKISYIWVETHGVDGELAVCWYKNDLNFTPM